MKVQPVMAAMLLPVLFAGAQVPLHAQGMGQPGADTGAGATPGTDAGSAPGTDATGPAAGAPGTDQPSAPPEAMPPAGSVGPDGAPTGAAPPPPPPGGPMAAPPPPPPAPAMTAPPPPPAKESYPVCTKTITDECVNPGEHKGGKRRR